MKASYILVPGLGDHKQLFAWFYAWVARRWRRQGLSVRVVSPQWATAEPYEAKYNRLLSVVAEEHQAGREVVLVGVSAGATLTYLAFAARTQGVRAFVSVCGFTQVKPSDYRNSALMKRSWYQAAAAAERAGAKLSVKDRLRIFSLIPRTDSVIEPKQQYIDGAQNIRLSVSGHLWGIVSVLLFGRRRIVGYIDKLGMTSSV